MKLNKLVISPAKGLGKKHAVKELGRVIATKEEILLAFIIKYGLEPDEVEMVSKYNKKNQYITYVRRRR